MRRENKFRKGQLVIATESSYYWYDIRISMYRDFLEKFPLAVARLDRVDSDRKLAMIVAKEKARRMKGIDYIPSVYIFKYEDLIPLD